MITSHGAIEADKDNVRREPYSLPQGFMWDTLDLGNADVVSTGLPFSTCLRTNCFRVASERHRKDARLILQLKELYTLLNENYVEDEESMFRFDYSPEFLLW